MDKWFKEIATKCELSAEAEQRLCEDGFVVIEHAAPQSQLPQLSEAYDAAVLAAHPDDVRVGSASTRVHDFVNRGPAFDELYLYGPLLAACCRVIARPFKLSTMLARTLEPGAPAQPLHVDFQRYDDGWPMIGFIMMVDDFRPDNGATRFVPGSHRTRQSPGDVPGDASAGYDGGALACGRAGAMIIYNGSVCHGHTANRSISKRRSIQGAFIRREAEAAMNQSARIRPETLRRIGELAKYLLALE